MPLSTVRDAYAARSADYIDLLGSIEDTAEPDREYVLAWAQRVDGRIVDVGCASLRASQQRRADFAADFLNCRPTGLIGCRARSTSASKFPGDSSLPLAD